MVDLGGMAQQLGPIIAFIIFGSLFVAVPIGLMVGLLVRHTRPIVTPLNVALLGGYIVIVVILFVVLRRVAEFSLYTALAASVVISAGIIFAIALMLRRYLRTHTPDATIDQDFSVFGEDIRDKRKNLRKKP